MPDPALINERGRTLLDMIPTWFRLDADVLGIMHAGAREFDAVNSSVDLLQAGLVPSQASLLLAQWETLVGLPVNPTRTEPARRQALLTALRRLSPDPSGLRWQADMDLIMPAGWSYKEHIPGDATSPPENTIRIAVTDSAATPGPVALLRILRSTIPANLAIQVTYTTGFRLDSGVMDSQTWYVSPAP